MMVHQGLSTPDLPEEQRAFFQAFGAKYGYSPEAGEAAPARVIEILNALSNLLEEQQAQGSQYFYCNALSALDIYWAGFSHLIEPLPPDECQCSKISVRSIRTIIPAWPPRQRRYLWITAFYL